MAAAVPLVLADVGAGACLPLAELDQQPRRVELKPDVQVTFRPVSLWNLPFMLLFVVTLMTLDWTLRRHCGLIL